jgi:molybdopterin-guanine dinucleotide biosynthesis protein A
MDATAIILSGGKSSRMGTNKALLKINEMTNIERIITRLQTGFPNPVLVTNDPEAYRFLGIKTIGDHFQGKGPIAGIHAGLCASSTELNVVAACDMPFISVKLAAALVEKIQNYDAVIPVIGGRQQPLFAVYKKKLAGVMEECLKADRLRIKDLLDSVNALYLTEQELKVELSLDRIFFNMNNPYEYEEALQLAREERTSGWCGYEAGTIDISKQL